MLITKSDYLRFIQCPKFAWLFINRPDLVLPPDKNEQLKIEEGYQVETLAYKLFDSKDKIITEDKLQGSLETEKYIKEGAKIIHQATFIVDELYCRSDILKFNNETNKFDIYEIKATTEVDKQHIKDLAFQKIVLEKQGLSIGETYVVHVNNQYIRNGEIDINQYFSIENKTIEVIEKLEEVKNEISKLKEVLTFKEELNVEILSQCKNPETCNFIDYCQKDIPDDSIYNFQFRENKLMNLIDEGIIHAKDIPDSYLTNDLKKYYVESLNTGKPHIEKDKIKEELSKLKYPLYFLDYETLNPAIPMFNGYKPYQRVVFQYSLHIQQTPYSELEHFEFLGKENTDPSIDLVKTLKEIIKDDNGSVIVWNKSFEMGCNREMAERYPNYNNFLLNVNERVFDLMDIFHDAYYVDGRFHGSWSIKKVLPILVPELSYKELNIKEGMTASNSWREMILEERFTQEDRDKIHKDLTTYCHLDTLAMVKILNYLNNI